MSSRAGVPVISNRLVYFFLEAALEEVGADKLPAVLAGSKIDPATFGKDALTRLDGAQAAGFYASLQQAVRLYYGRGARGLLLRIGQNMWERMTAQANLLEKAELEIARRLPVPARRRRVLDLVAGRLQEGGGAASVHTLDLGLLLVDRSGAAAAGQSGSEPVCFVTLGLIRGSLFWATGQEADVEEIACKATGAPACEFKIVLGGK